MELHEILKETRISFGYSQQNIADFLGIDRSTYSYYETGKTRPSVKTITLLSKLYDITINEFLGIATPNPKPSVTFAEPQNINKEFGEEIGSYSDLTYDEQRLILLFRTLTNKREVLDKLKEYVVSQIEFE